MKHPSITDPLRETYREAFVTNPTRVEFLAEGKIALLCIDVQYLDAADGWGLFADPAKSGVPEEGRKYYFDRLKKLVLPGMRKLQDAFRERGLEVIHCRICALTKDGRDRGLGHRRLHLLAAPGSKEAEFLEEVAPVGDEIVINKTASGVFSSTNLHYVLGNMGIKTLYALTQLIRDAFEDEATDVFIVEAEPPRIRREGDVVHAPPRPDHARGDGGILAILRHRSRHHAEADVSWPIPGAAAAGESLSHARPARRRAAADPQRPSPPRRTRPARRAAGVMDATPLRPDPRHRPDRLGQVHHRRLLPGLDQPPPRPPHRDAGGSHRVSV
jgi:hypothetical protein